MSAAPPTVSLHSVTQGYGRFTVLHDVSFALHAGVTALLGPNGAGKTTTINTLTTLIAPRGGQLRFQGSPVTSLRDVRTMRAAIGYLPQGFAPDPGFTVEQSVEYAAWLRMLPAARAREAVGEALRHVDLEDVRKHRVRRLSGGMRQRLGIATAIVGSPDLVVLDEPTVGLDPAQRAMFRTSVQSLSSSTVLLSTHLIEDVEALATHVIVIAAGKIAFDGPTADLRSLGAPGTGTGDLEAGYLTVVNRFGPTASRA